MKPSTQVFRLALLGLPVAPLLSGCVTTHFCGSEQYAALPDRVDKVEKAWLAEGNRLLICFEGQPGDRPQAGPYTVVVPFARDAIRPYPDHPPGDTTNVVVSTYGSLTVLRDAIVPGWLAEDESSAAYRAVAIGKPILEPLHKHGFEIPNREAYGHLPHDQRAVYPVAAATTNAPSLWPGPPNYVYVDPARPEAFTEIRIASATKPVYLIPSKWRYALLPLTVPADIVLSPVYLGWVIASGHL